MPVLSCLIEAEHTFDMNIYTSGLVGHITVNPVKEVQASKIQARFRKTF